MPIAAFQFDTFQSIASDVGEASWSNPGNGQESDNAYAAALLSSFSAAVVTEYLVCTGADLSALPGNILFTKIEVNIEAQGTNSELFEILGCESDGSGGLTLGGLNLLRAAGAGPIDLTGSDTVYPRGRNNWNFWWRDRLQNPDFGVAIRARLKQGQFSGTVSIDHVELVVHYETFVKPFVRKDTRPVMEVRVAGVNGRQLQNAAAEVYQPGRSWINRYDWHLESQVGEFLDEHIGLRTATGAKRLCLRMPAGRTPLQGLIPSGQWEPMYDYQRDALIDRIGAWVRSDPEHEVSLYIGAWIKDPGKVDMSGTPGEPGGPWQPDVQDAEDVAILERIFFPYRDLVGVTRFFLDNSGVHDESLSLALFTWGRRNGMEFVYEAIPGMRFPPHLPDLDRVGPFDAYANAKEFILHHDPDFKARFERGDCTALFRISDFEEEPCGPECWPRRLKDFARAGYAFQTHDRVNGVSGLYESIDDFALQVGSQFEQRRIHHPVAYSIASPVARSVRHLVRHPTAPAAQNRGMVPGSVVVSVAHAITFPLSGT